MLRRSRRPGRRDARGPGGIDGTNDRPIRPGADASRCSAIAEPRSRRNWSASWTARRCTSARGGGRSLRYPRRRDACGARRPAEGLSRWRSPSLGATRPSMPQSDPVVRFEARRLRRDLDSYYVDAGSPGSAAHHHSQRRLRSAFRVAPGADGRAALRRQPTPGRAAPVAGATGAAAAADETAGAASPRAAAGRSRMLAGAARRRSRSRRPAARGSGSTARRRGRRRRAAPPSSSCPSRRSAPARTTASSPPA